MGMILNPYVFATGGGLPPGTMEVEDFAYTGSQQSTTSPTTGYATVILWGGGGGAAMYDANGHGGPGGALIATFPVTNGDDIAVDVGQGGQGGGATGGAGGWPDGGGGGNGDVKCGGGGGSTRFYVEGALKAVAGAAGGGAWSPTIGGYGGGTTGGKAQNGAGGVDTTIGGSGGSQVAGGLDLSDTGNANKTGRSLVSFPGAQRIGGWGSSVGDHTTSTADDGGGGGGGFYGGGGGGGDGQAGGGGSSWTDSDATDVTHFQALLGAPSFGPEGAVDIGHAGLGKNSGTANPGGNGYARVIFHDGSAGVGVLGHTQSLLVTPINSAAGDKWAIPVTVPSGGVWVKEIQVALPVATVTAGDQFRGVIYSSPGGAGVAQSADALLFSTPDYTVLSTDQMKLVRCAFAAWTFLAAGNYWVGVHASGATDICRKVGATVRAATGDTFAGGAVDPWGANVTTTDAPRLAIPYSVLDPT